MTIFRRLRAVLRQREPRVASEIACIRKVGSSDRIADRLGFHVTTRLSAGW